MAEAKSRYKIVKTFTISTRHQDLMTRFEMMLVQMQYNSRIGHSAYFGMFVDGDGIDQMDVEELKTSDYIQVRKSPSGDFEHPISSSGTYARENFR